MSKAKYVVPVIMGQPGSELFLVKGEIPRGQTMVLVRLITERALTSKDERGINLLEREERVQLLAGLNQLRVHNSHSRYDPYR